MRKKGISAGMVLLSAVLLTACGSAGTGTPATTAVETTTTAEDTTAAEANAAGAGNAGTNAAETQADTGADNNTEASVVYFTSDISPEGLMKVYERLNWTPEGKVAVKLSTGEPPASNYLEPELIKDLVQSVNGTIVECNTAYDGSRAETAMHRQVAEDHGFTAIAEVDIMDAVCREQYRPVTDEPDRDGCVRGNTGNGSGGGASAGKNGWRDYHCRR